MRKLLMLTGSVLVLSFYSSCNVSLASQINKNFTIEKDDMDITSPKQKILEENKIEEEQEDILINQDNLKREAMKSASRRVNERLGLKKEKKEIYKK